MVVDSTFNFEKKRLTPTRRLLGGISARETLNYCFWLREDPDAYWCVTKDSIPMFIHVRGFVVALPHTNIQTRQARVRWQGPSGFMTPYSFVTGTTEIWWSRPSEPEIRRRTDAECCAKRKSFSQLVFEGMDNFRCGSKFMTFRPSKIDGQRGPFLWNHWIPLVPSDNLT